MGVSMREIFGGGAGAEPATPGSYGEAPSGFRLPAATRLGPVHLQVGDLGRSLAFYEETLGLRLVGREASRATLTAHGDHAPLVELHERPGAWPALPRGRLGLFHFAILLPDRASLGRFVRHLDEADVRAGAADHLVSEALYLQDPDSLGIEVYADRARSTWRRIGRQLMMATDPVDVAGLLDAAGDQPWTGMPAGTTIGHLHLHVGDLATATAFYSEALGFDRMVWQYPGALFFGAGGYHHHLGANTWAGRGATPPELGDARLLEWTVLLPGVAALEAVAESLTRSSAPVERGRENEGPPWLVTRDPWGTAIRVRVAAP